MPYYTPQAIAALVLHEVGHTVDCREVHGERWSWDAEHFADWRAGYFAGRLGYDRDGVKEFYFSELNSASWSHPPARSRYGQFVAGHRKGLTDRHAIAFLRGFARELNR